MNKKDAYLRKNYTARRGGTKRRVLVKLFQEQKLRRDVMPKYAKWGMGITGSRSYNLKFFGMDARKQAHRKEREISVLNKHFRSRLNPNRHDYRKYWKKERDPLEGD